MNFAVMVDRICDCEVYTFDEPVIDELTVSVTDTTSVSINFPSLPNLTGGIEDTACLGNAGDECMWHLSSSMAPTWVSISGFTFTVDPTLLDETMVGTYVIDVQY